MPLGLLPTSQPRFVGYAWLLINQLFSLGNQLRGFDVECSRQLEDRSNRRLVLPRFNQGDEIALNPRRQPQLLLAEPGSQPKSFSAGEGH